MFLLREQDVIPWEKIRDPCSWDSQSIDSEILDLSILDLSILDSSQFHTNVLARSVNMCSGLVNYITKEFVSSELSKEVSWGHFNFMQMSLASLTSLFHSGVLSARLK